MGLEGLVLKDLESIYEPGKRHWLKVKKDYLFDGAMADSADLVVLGAWFGNYQLFYRRIIEGRKVIFSKMFSNRASFAKVFMAIIVLLCHSVL